MGVSIFHISLNFAEVKIPVIVVLTKYDLRVMEPYCAGSHKLSVVDKKAEATMRAKHAFSDVSNELEVPFVLVSMKEYGGLLI
jgi:hypothetical protein